MIVQFLKAKRPHREQMMSKKGRQALEQLPETVTIYRGYSYPDAKKGWSWTLSLRHAKWYAKRFVLLSDSPATVAVGEARKSDVVALLQPGAGRTIVIDPSNVKIKSLLRPAEEQSQ